MLKFFRHKSVAKFVLWLIIILILPAFVLFGTERLSRRKGPTFVGFIDTKKVSFDELFDSMVAARSHLVLRYWNNPDELRKIVNDRALLAGIAWERLIMLKEAKKAKISVPDAEVANYIRSHPLFVRNGRFDDAMYAYFLRNNVGLSARSFEEAMREALTIDKFLGNLTKGMPEADKEKAASAALEKLASGAKLNIDFKEIDKYYK
jgi:hypothetical protein